MFRIAVICVLAGVAAFGQTTSVPPRGQASPPPQTSRPPVMPPVSPADQLPADATVVTVHGVCPGVKPADSAKPDSCNTTITKEQFNQIVALITYGNQTMNPAARRAFAENYIQMLALADAGEKAGMDKDAKFAELMKIMRIRMLADTYRHSLEAKYGNPSDQEIQAYYEKNQAKYEQLQLDRFYLPKVNVKNPNVNRADFEKRAEQMANKMHDRAAKGEEVSKLQVEAYTTLGLTGPPPTDLGMKAINTLSPVWQPEIAPLKPGEVTKVKSEAPGFTFYKLRARNVVPLAAVKQGIIHEVARTNMDAAIHSALDHAHPELNEQFFTTAPMGGRPVAQPPAAMPIKPAETQTTTTQKPSTPK